MNHRTGKLIRQYATEKELNKRAATAVWKDTPRRKRAALRRAMRRVVEGDK
jgi:hypothetical protein